MNVFFGWLASFLAFIGSFFNGHGQEQDFVGVVAAEAAYVTLLPAGTVPSKPKVDPKNCKTCNGTGRVRTGDDQGWTKCPDCQPMNDEQTPVSFSDAFPDFPPVLVLPSPTVTVEVSENKEKSVQSGATVVSGTSKPKAVYIIRRE